MPRGITLIPGELREEAVSPRWGVVVACVGVIVAALLVGIPWYRTERLLRDERLAVDALERRHRALVSRASVAAGDLQAYRATVARATALRALLAQHRSWAPFFRLIEARTLPSVRYHGLTADQSGSVSLSAVAPSVRAAAEQVVAWELADAVQSVETSGLANVTDELGVVRGTRFDLRVQVAPEVFLAK